MLRGLILLLISGLGLLTAPFLLTSLALDERGVTIPGRVSSKSETVTVHNSDWKRVAEATIRYEPPDSSSTSFLGVSLTPEQYDALHVGSAVALHYLPRRDVPAVPLSDILWQMHALPVARLADHRTFTNMERLFTPAVVTGLEAVGGLILLLVVLHKTSSPLFGWILGLSIATALAASFVFSFPKPTPKPVVGVRQASGRIKSLSRIDRLFEGNRARGDKAAQPVDVAGIEFVPAGRTESVVAVDLIDAGSVQGLAEHSTVPIEYEANSPRTAYIQNATRKFVSRNVRGLAVDGVLCLAVLIVMLGIGQGIGTGYRWLVRRATRPAPHDP